MENARVVYPILDAGVPHSSGKGDVRASGRQTMAQLAAKDGRVEIDIALDATTDAPPLAPCQPAITARISRA